MAGGRDTFPGLGSRPSGAGYGLSGAGTGAGPEPVPEPEHLNQIPEGRDPGPEKRVLAISGWRLGKQKDSGCDVIASLPKGDDRMG